MMRMRRTMMMMMKPEWYSIDRLSFENAHLIAVRFVLIVEELETRRRQVADSKLIVRCAIGKSTQNRDVCISAIQHAARPMQPDRIDVKSARLSVVMIIQACVCVGQIGILARPYRSAFENIARIDN